jgi:hypothetical protein
VTPRAADEAPHAPGSGDWWSDAWHLDAATADGAGLTVRLDCYPNQRRAWFWTYLVLPELPGPVVVRDHEVTLPRQGLEVRAEGLWAELWCETPLEHWTYGLEAFAVRLDDPSDALRGEIGERMPVGLDLEWEVDGPTHAYGADWPVEGFVEPGIVHGEILLGRDRFEFDARGAYQRSWGPRSWGAAGSWVVTCAGRDLAMHVEGLADASVDGFIQAGEVPGHLVMSARREAHAGAARLVLDDEVEVEVEVITGAPVPIEGVGVVDRAVCRFCVGGVVENGWSSVLEPL